MTTATCTEALTPAKATRLSHRLCTSQGLPPLPHIPGNFLAALAAIIDDRLYCELFGKLGALTPEQQEANLRHVALWIVERDRKNLDMGEWHMQWLSNEETYTKWAGNGLPSNEAGFHTCGTVHCLAGFAQVMGGIGAFALSPEDAGVVLLGPETATYFYLAKGEVLAFLEQVIARNSQ